MNVNDSHNDKEKILLKKQYKTVHQSKFALVYGAYSGLMYLT